jgi:hypothetical protein
MISLTQEQIQLLNSLKGEVDKIKVNILLENKKLDQIADAINQVINYVQTNKDTTTTP